MVKKSFFFIIIIITTLFYNYIIIPSHRIIFYPSSALFCRVIYFIGFPIMDRALWRGVGIGRSDTPRSRIPQYNYVLYFMGIFCLSSTNEYKVLRSL